MLSKQGILDKTNSGFDVFRYYIRTEWRIGKNFRNPFYDDKNASCNIYFDKKSRTYKFKDFGNSEYFGDCFDIVGKLKRLDCNNPKDFIIILQTINHDLNLGLRDEDYDNSFVVSVSIPESKQKNQPENPPRQTPKKTKPYFSTQQSFLAKELSFWAQYGIAAEILRRYKVVSLKEFQSESNDGKPFAFRSTDCEPIFGYLGKKHVKIYRPFSDVRFLYGGNYSKYGQVLLSTFRYSNGGN